MKINANFDGGNIEVIECNSALEIVLKIRKDTNSDFMQWFYFSLHDVKNRQCRINIDNAKDVSYPEGFEDYMAYASYDKQDWFRVNTKFDSQSLIITHKPKHDTIYFAYYIPFSYEMHQGLIAKAQTLSCCKHIILGETKEKRNIDLLVIGDEARSPLRVWITARQHPGETMAEWFMQGLIERFFNLNDPVVRSLLSTVTFYFVPNMNPDGSYNGNLRTNANGINLNREWEKPSLELSPEVFLVRKKMLSTGIDLYLDIHGDEGLPYCFFAGCEGNPSYSERIQKLEELMAEAYQKINPDFQTVYGYPKDKPKEANLGIASNWVGETFDCLSLTLEMPFKDNLNFPDKLYGFSEKRASSLGYSLLNVILFMLAKLR